MWLLQICKSIPYVIVLILPFDIKYIKIRRILALWVEAGGRRTYGDKSDTAEWQHTTDG